MACWGWECRPPAHPAPEMPPLGTCLRPLSPAPPPPLQHGLPHLGLALHCSPQGGWHLLFLLCWHVPQPGVLLAPRVFLLGFPCSLSARPLALEELRSRRSWGLGREGPRWLPVLFLLLPGGLAVWPTCGLLSAGLAVPRGCTAASRWMPRPAPPGCRNGPRPGRGVLWPEPGQQVPSGAQAGLGGGRGSHALQTACFALSLSPCPSVSMACLREEGRTPGPPSPGW